MNGTRGRSGFPERIQSTIEVVTRALGRRANLDAFDEGSGASDFESPLSLLRGEPSLADNLSAFRGVADGLAMRLRYHDERVSPIRNSSPGVTRDILQALLQVRCEALGRRNFPGVAVNLDAALEARSLKERWAAASVRRDSDLPLALSLLALETIAGASLPPAALHLAGTWRSELRDFNANLQLCAQSVEDQVAFTQAVEQLLSSLRPGGHVEQSISKSNTPGHSEQPLEALRADGEVRGGPDSDSTHDVDTPLEPERTAEQSPTAINAGDPFAEGGGAGTTEAITGFAAADVAAASLGATDGLAALSLVAAGSDDRYRVFTTQFDETVDADELCEPAEFTELWQQFRVEMSPYERLIGKLAGRLQRKLLAKQYQAVEHDQDEGLLDSARLARVIATPLRPLACRRETLSSRLDTVVTLLIDNSASMRGRAIATAAATGNILARALERCGVKVEILGYTTRTWGGGECRRLWMLSGRPSSPGRLNELRHIVYKSADTPWRRAQANLGVMAKPGLLKENIDGEALLWAHGRLLKRPEMRRILVVVSDGAPIDDSTLSSNPPGILTSHLCAVTQQITRSGQVELIGIGIRRDISAFYPRAFRLPDVSALGHTAVSALARLLGDDCRVGRG